MMTPKSLFQCYCCARLLWMKWPKTVDKPQFGMADFQWTDCPISLDNMTVFASGIHVGVVISNGLNGLEFKSHPILNI